jgi:predicted TIM-barrel fold metal-dependent hydrolase
MITIYEKNNEKKKPLKLLVVDTHTHLGKEEVRKGRGKDFRIIRPKDHIDFYEKLKYDIYKRITNYTQDTAYELSAEVNDFTQSTTQLQALIFSQKRTTQNIGWFADKIVTFPLHDILQSKTDPHFMRSNNYIISRAQSMEYGSRLVPFCRVDPNDGEKAVDELKRCISYGARGLKLHPLSEKWLEDIVTPEVIKLVRVAADFKLPVLFDCQNYQTAQEIHQVAMEARSGTKNKDFAVIIGHFGFDYQTKGMFELLEDPNIKTETSGMRGDDCAIFYKNCIDLVEDWHLSTMYGSDHNYFSVPQASDHIVFLLSEQARELGIEFEHIKHVLGINALRILKLYWPEQVLDRQGVEQTNVQWKDFDVITSSTTYQQLADNVAKLSAISGVYFNIDNLLDPSGTNVYGELFILNLFADIVNIRRSFVVQQKDGKKLKVSEITKLMDYATEITKLLEESQASYPFTQKYLFNYLLHQKPHTEL